MSPRSHEPFEELAVGYALDALEPQEEQAFAAHLASCARCEREVAGHLGALGQLAYSAPALVPPASLWEGIRAGVEEMSGPDAFGAPARTPEPQPVSDLAHRRTSRRARAALAGRAAAVVSAAAGLVLVAGLVVQNAALREDKARDLAWSRGMERVVSTYGDGARTVTLSSESGTDAVAVAVLEGRRLHLVVDGLEANDRRRTTYVLWQKSVMGAVTAVGAFDVEGDHQVEVVEDLMIDDPTTLAALVLTRESGRKAPPVSRQPALATGAVL